MSALKKLLLLGVILSSLFGGGLVKAANTLKFTAPAAGSSYKTGESLIVSWTGEWMGVSQATVKLYKGGIASGFQSNWPPSTPVGERQNFGTVALASGSVSGALPELKANEEPSAFFFVALVFDSGGAFVSDNFSITGSAGPPPGGGTCGDNQCSGSETQASCPTDCTGTQPPPGGSKLPDPVAPGLGQPGDLDGDGLYEDVDGDGYFGVADCTVLAKYLPSDNTGVIADNKDAFNFNDGDAEVNFGDVQACLELLRKGGPPGSPVVVFEVKLTRTNTTGDVEAGLVKPADAYNCFLDWGDNSPKVGVDFNDTTTATHKYIQTGNYTVIFQCQITLEDTLERRAAIAVDGPADNGTPVTENPDELAEDKYYSVLFVPLNYTNQSQLDSDASRVKQMIQDKLLPISGLASAKVKLTINPQGYICDSLDDQRCHGGLSTIGSQSPIAGELDLVLGVCAADTCTAGKVMNGQYCVRVSTGAVAGIPTKVAIVDLLECALQKAQYTMSASTTVLHEIGHTLDLYHIAACDLPDNLTECRRDDSGYNGAVCNVKKAQWCRGANATDCNEADRETNLMSYCLKDRSHYGAAGTVHIKERLNQIME